MFRLLRVTRRLLSTTAVAPRPEIDHYNVDLEKYRDLDQPVKIQTGYAFVDVEPFPRMQLMKVCMQLLHKLKELPEDYLYRTYEEERIKWIMETAHETPRVADLEQKLGDDCIEIFVESLAESYGLYESILKEKPWLGGDAEEEKEFASYLNMTEDETLRFAKKEQETPSARLK